MKTEPNEPIVPSVIKTGDVAETTIGSYDATKDCYGLTKREYFAARAMEGEMAAGGSAFSTVHCAHIAEISVTMADALIAALNSPAADRADK